MTSTSPPRLQFFFDFVSPYSYLASTQLDALAARRGIEITWEPALLGAIMKATGNTPPAALPARAQYLMGDLARWAVLYDVPFSFSPYFPPNSMAALRGALHLRATNPAAFAIYNRLMFRATWGEGKDPSSRDVIGAIAKAAGADADAVIAANDDATVKAMLKAQTERAVAEGAFGMPYFVLESEGVREKYFGNDRLELIERRLARAQPWPNAPDVGPITFP